MRPKLEIKGTRDAKEQKLAALKAKKEQGKLTLEDLDEKLDIVIEMLKQRQ